MASWNASGLGPTAPDIFLASNLQKRYTTLSIPASYGRLNSSPPPGTVAGIVLGTVGGVVLVLYLTFLALNPGGLARGGSSSTIDEEVVIRSLRGPSSRHRGEAIEVMEERSRSRSYRRPSRDHVVVDESVTGTGTSVTDHGDVVEIFEEESSGVSSASPRPPRRTRSGVRTVDPHGYGGGSSYAGSRYR